MTVSQSIREAVAQQAQGAMRLQLAFIGVHNGLFAALAEAGALTTDELAQRAGVDAAYVGRWCDAAYAFELLDEDGEGWRMTELGGAFVPGEAGNLMPAAVGAALSAHMAERAAALMQSGERPGERVLAERATLLPWFGPMLEQSFGPIFDQHILAGVPAYKEVDAKGGLAVDLGCGNGWYLRRMAARFHNLRGIGLDGFEENIRQAEALAAAEGVADRLSFRSGDLHQFNIAEPVDLIAMNRALHHVWNEKENVFRILKEHLKPGGYAIIWEPSWPASRRELRLPNKRPMAFQNLAEHIQGNHFLRPDEIQGEFERVGMGAEVHLFLGGNESVVVARRPA